jgi:hypothetical protein
MNDPAAIAAIVGLAACLILAVRGFHSRRPGFNRTLIMGVVWAVVIAALAAILQRHGS